MYKDLKWLWGREVELYGDVILYALPSKIVMIRDYPNTMLLEMTFKGSEWGADVPPRKVRYLFDKAQFCCGKLKLRFADGVLLDRTDILWK